MMADDDEYDPSRIRHPVMTNPMSAEAIPQALIDQSIVLNWFYVSVPLLGHIYHINVVLIHFIIRSFLTSWVNVWLEVRTTGLLNVWLRALESLLTWIYRYDKNGPLADCQHSSGEGYGPSILNSSVKVPQTYSFLISILYINQSWQPVHATIPTHNRRSSSRH